MRPGRNFERLLREALAPVEPPADLVERLESTLKSITEMAAEELEDVGAVGDARPAQLGAPGGGARGWQRGGGRAGAAARPAARRNPPSGPALCATWLGDACAISVARRASSSEIAERA